MSRVGLVFGGRSVEHRVSVRSARAVAEALAASGHVVVPLPIAPDGCWLAEGVGHRALAGAIDELPEGGGSPVESLRVLGEAAAEVLFPLVHGTWGEDGTLQGLCEMLDVAYVGAGVTSSAVAMDKHLTKVVLEGGGIRVAPWICVRRRDFERDAEGAVRGVEELGMPLFVKPSVGGSSVGVVKVRRREELAPAVSHALRFDDAVLVETAIPGRELECSVLGYAELEASLVGEIVPGAEFYDYADKYLNDTAGLIVPAVLDTAVEDEIRAAATRAFELLGGWGMARVDFLLGEDDSVVVNEINTLPGFTSISMYPKLWEASGLAMPQLVDRLVRIAVERHADRRRLDAGIREWLAGLAE